MRASMAMALSIALAALCGCASTVGSGASAVAEASTPGVESVDIELRSDDGETRSAVLERAFERLVGVREAKASAAAGRVRLAVDPEARFPLGAIPEIARQSGETVRSVRVMLRGSAGSSDLSQDGTRVAPVVIEAATSRHASDWYEVHFEHDRIRLVPSRRH